MRRAGLRTCLWHGGMCSLNKAGHDSHAALGTRSISQQLQCPQELELMTAWQGFQDAIGMVTCSTGSLGDWLLSAAGPEVQLTNLFDQKTINLQV